MKRQQRLQRCEPEEDSEEDGLDTADSFAAIGEIPPFPDFGKEAGSGSCDGCDSGGGGVRPEEVADGSDGGGGGSRGLPEASAAVEKQQRPGQQSGQARQEQQAERHFVTAVQNLADQLRRLDRSASADEVDIGISKYQAGFWDHDRLASYLGLDIMNNRAIDG